MISNDSYWIVSALIFNILTKFLYTVLYFARSMHKKGLLDSIPEKNESEEEVQSTKWVPKKKHEVLKAKYKCLKKLFQIYDASVIGILPEPYDQVDNYATAADAVSRTERHHHSKKKRSFRTKTDACSGTVEDSSGDGSVRSEDKGSVASAVIRDLKIQCSCSTQMISEEDQRPQPRLDRAASSLATDNFTEHIPPSMYHQPTRVEHPSMMQPMPYLIYNEQRKPTRFQIFIQRLFGIRRELRAEYGANGHIYAASDNNITYNYCEKRRRRGLRFRRLRRAKKAHSETMFRDVASPTILNCVQSVQRSCLNDRTARTCPILGCKMMFYGIINYNDHLNLCHFTDRKFICHYCHEGFVIEYEKYTHENEHLGVNKLNHTVQNVSATSTLRQSQKSSNTQTEGEKCDVPEDKLKKIVSFFDKIVDNDQVLAELKRNRELPNKYSDYNMHSSDKSESECATESGTATSGGKRVVSCGNLLNRKVDKCKSDDQSDFTTKCQNSPVRCHICGEDFDYRKQLNLHVGVEHGRRDKPSKFHSCAGIADYRRHSGMVKFEAGKINIQSLHDVGQPSSTSVTQDLCSVGSRQKSEGSLSCDPSTNIIYYPSMGSVIKPAVNTFTDKARNGIASYRWEPGTKIIRV